MLGEIGAFVVKRDPSSCLVATGGSDVGKVRSALRVTRPNIE